MSILQKIAETKRVEIAELKKTRGLSSLKEGARAQAAPRDFLKAVHRPGRLSLIGELKKASPSKGVLKQDFQIEPLAKAYAKAGVHALSVLTDVQYFQGDLSYLKKAKEVSGLPVLRKDFLIDEHQIYEAREAGADAILLIAAMMPPAKLKELMAVADELKMTALVEVHDERELEVALRAGTRLMGINNRNLDDFTVTLQTTLDLIGKCPKDLPVVSESGIFTREDCLRLQKAGASTVLVGEAFMTSPDIEAAVKALMPSEA
ncbi:MAG TPA: indole-3-glycerol phosphate synthase TrpC [bacterium]|jgi:indole-3-glycerol phosphate synthase|nr:indole-3-glycerol phosphate synthase TrpC [bacterium]